MNDSPYRNTLPPNPFQPSAKMFLSGFVVLVLGFAIQAWARFLLATFLYDLISSPAGINPSGLVDRFFSWTYLAAFGTGISILGTGILLSAVWRSVRTNQ